MNPSFVYKYFILLFIIDGNFTITSIFNNLSLRSIESLTHRIYISIINQRVMSFVSIIRDVVPDRYLNDQSIMERVSRVGITYVLCTCIYFIIQIIIHYSKHINTNVIILSIHCYSYKFMFQLSKLDARNSENNQTINSYMIASIPPLFSTAPAAISLLVSGASPAAVVGHASSQCCFSASHGCYYFSRGYYNSSFKYLASNHLKAIKQQILLVEDADET